MSQYNGFDFNNKKAVGREPNTTEPANDSCDWLPMPGTLRIFKKKKPSKPTRQNKQSFYGKIIFN